MQRKNKMKREQITENINKNKKKIKVKHNSIFQTIKCFKQNKTFVSKQNKNVKYYQHLSNPYRTLSSLIEIR